ncbi:DegT/DnrJ/EryC1/StrS family aminotransferase [Streptomyces sp. NPDC050738]|uniref:DegT/DnrJ/EryC1/StrS family aminotransferase n=1 Tax=Streptomyces sp. NPDC050738 TaxID=3154744 RepID=UPI00343AD922
MSTLRLLKAAGIGAGDEVIVSAYGDVEAAEAVRAVGGMVVLADIDPDTYCLDARSVEISVTSRTAGVVLTHRFGHPPDMVAMRELARRRGLFVVEQAVVGDGREQAAYLSERLRGMRTPSLGAGHSCESYVVRVPGNGRPDRDAVARALKVRGVECWVPVPAPLHRLPAFRRDVRLPEAELASDETLALPLHGDVRRTAAACNALGGLLQPAF